jgi:hypothetical protein
MSEIYRTLRGLRVNSSARLWRESESLRSDAAALRLHTHELYSRAVEARIEREDTAARATAERREHVDHHA